MMIRERESGRGGRGCWAIEAAIAIGIGIESALFGNSTSGPCSAGVVKRWRGWGWVVGRGGKCGSLWQPLWQLQKQFNRA